MPTSLDRRTVADFPGYFDAEVARRHEYRIIASTSRFVLFLADETTVPETTPGHTARTLEGALRLACAYSHNHGVYAD